MTESEWLTSEDPLALLEYVTDQATQRKYRLFLCACCTRVLASTPLHRRLFRKYYPGSWYQLEQAMGIVEQVAEGFVSTDLLAQARKDADQSTYVPDWIDWGGETKFIGEALAVIAAAVEHPVAAEVLEACWRAAIWQAEDIAREENSQSTEKDHLRVETQWQAVVCRDVFGNPFRPISFSPEWRTAATVSLAARMYQSRDFSAMPELVDALQDAGCKATAILDHCRSSSPHVRGCWVVDLVLGKE